MLDEAQDTQLSAEQRQLFEHIFIEKTPLLDLRSPGEFEQGAFPTSTNIPLMTNEQRALVGTCYKQQGKEAAIELGHELVSGEVKEQLLQQWSQFCRENPKGYLYCFRGGLRSKTVAEWLSELGVDYPRIEGGYKALRRYLIEQTQHLVNSDRLLIVGGKTGTAKTHFINAWQQSIDLEGLANHRGSSFGRRPAGQPGVIDFENQLAIELLKISRLGNQYLLEDEGVTIGSCSIPVQLREAMRQAPVLLLTLPFEERVETILRDYVIDLRSEYIGYHPADGFRQYQKAMLASLERIQKRLGGARYKEIRDDLQRALNQDDDELHRIWISKLLNYYYDPMYQYQLSKKQHRIKLQGNAETLSEYLLKEGFTKQG